MRELQESDPKASIRDRNELRRRRRDRLERLRKFHNERPEDVARVARETAERIIADFKQRDRLAGVPDETEVRSLMELRERLLAATAECKVVGSRLAALQQEDRTARGAAAKGADQGDNPRIAELAVLGEACVAEYDRIHHEATTLEREFERRTEAAGCMPALYTRHLEEDLERAKTDTRRASELVWDASQEISRHFVSNLTAKGIDDHRFRLDADDDALAYSLVLRALLSEDPTEDLIGGAVRKLEDEWLIARKKSSWVHGLPLHRYVSLMLWPRSKEHKDDVLPLHPDLRRRRLIEAKDERLRWFVLATEQALEALIGEALREDQEFGLTQARALTSERQFEGPTDLETKLKHEVHADIEVIKAREALQRRAKDMLAQVCSELDVKQLELRDQAVDRLAKRIIANFDAEARRRGVPDLARLERAQELEVLRAEIEKVPQAERKEEQREALKVLGVEYAAITAELHIPPHPSLSRLEERIAAAREGRAWGPPPQFDVAQAMVELALPRLRSKRFAGFDAADESILAVEDLVYIRAAFSEDQLDDLVRARVVELEDERMANSHREHGGIWGLSFRECLMSEGVAPEGMDEQFERGLESLSLEQRMARRRRLWDEHLIRRAEGALRVVRSADKRTPLQWLRDQCISVLASGDKVAEATRRYNEQIARVEVPIDFKYFPLVKRMTDQQRRADAAANRRAKEMCPVAYELRDDLARAQRRLRDVIDAASGGVSCGNIDFGDRARPVADQEVTALLTLLRETSGVFPEGLAGPLGDVQLERWKQVRAQLDARVDVFISMVERGVTGSVAGLQLPAARTAGGPAPLAGAELIMGTSPDGGLLLEAAPDLSRSDAGVIGPPAGPRNRYTAAQKAAAAGVVADNGGLTWSQLSELTGVNMKTLASWSVTQQAKGARAHERFQKNRGGPDADGDHSEDVSGQPSPEFEDESN